jgi:hypothetical protein
VGYAAKGGKGGTKMRAAARDAADAAALQRSVEANVASGSGSKELARAAAAVAAAAADNV